MLECQNIKESLSINDEDFLHVDVFVPLNEDIMEITRKEFEEMSTNLLEKVKICILTALNDCKFTVDDINKILLVGGGSRMPMIKELLKDLFKNAEHLCAKHPDEIVAIGVAYYSYYLNSMLKKDFKFVSLEKLCSRKRKSME